MSDVIKNLIDERDHYRIQAERAVSDRDEWKSKYEAAESNWSDEVLDLTAEIRQLTKQVEMQRSLLNTLPVDDIPTSKWLDNYLQYRREQESSASDSQRSEP